MASSVRDRMFQAWQEIAGQILNEVGARRGLPPLAWSVRAAMDRWTTVPPDRLSGQALVDEYHDAAPQVAAQWAHAFGLMPFRNGATVAGGVVAWAGRLDDVSLRVWAVTDAARLQAWRTGRAADQ